MRNGVSLLFSLIALAGMVAVLCGWAPSAEIVATAAFSGAGTGWLALSQTPQFGWLSAPCSISHKEPIMLTAGTYLAGGTHHEPRSLGPDQRLRGDAALRLLAFASVGSCATIRQGYEPPPSKAGGGPARAACLTTCGSLFLPGAPWLRLCDAQNLSQSCAEMLHRVTGIIGPYVGVVLAGVGSD